jgi:nucleotide-binding universal stress UspA family protein
MKQLKKILIPTDFSPLAAKAFQYAVKLAEKFDAKVKVIHVYRADFGVPVPETMAYQMLDARREEALKNLENFIAENNFGSKEVVIESDVEMGFPSDVVVDLSKNKNETIDLIVMGTKGEHNLAEKVFGSVTANVMRDAHCPVMAIPENADAFNVDQIAYATDLKSDTADSVREAAEFAKMFNASLHCVRVDTKAEDLSSELIRFNEMTSKLDVEIKIVEFSSDSIARGLDLYVQENGIDMVMMYRPQRSLFERIFHSSVTKQVAMHSKVPLLVFKKQ